MILWLLVAAMSLVSLAFVVPPLFRSTGAKGMARKDLHVELYRGRIAELEADRDAGTLAADQFDAAKLELDRSLLVDLEDEPEDGSGAPISRPARIAGLVTAIVLPAIAFTFYTELGRWDAIDSVAPTAAAESQVHTADNAGNAGTIESLIGKLEERLQQNPDDLEGWVMLGRSYMYLDRHQDAVGAFARADALGGDQIANVLVDYAEAMGYANQRSLAGAPSRLLAKALSLEPDNLKGLWLAGLASFEAKDYSGAVQLWQQLQSLTPEDGDGAESLAANIARAQSLAQGGELETIPAPPQTAAAAPQTQADSTDAAGASLQVQVSLAPELAAQAQPTDTLFVLARAATGPRMPLAVVRKQVSDLPMTVTLDDSMAMMPQMTLSSFAEVIVDARISKSGQPTPGSGDLQGSSGVISVAENGELDIQINEQLP